MKTKLFLTLAGVMFGLHITAQEVQQFVGIYTIQEICKSCTYPMPPDTTDYEIEIKASSVDTFDIQLYLKEHGLYEAIGANITNDSTFQIPLQTFQNFDNSLHISGAGKVIQDSITINYNVGTSGGTLECTCKGTRKKESGLNRISDDTWTELTHHISDPYCANTSSWGEPTFDFYKIDNDTIIKGLTYQQVYYENDNKSVGGIRTVGNTIYFYNNELEKEIVLYDFSWKVGDTIHFNVASHDTIFLESKQVNKIDSITLLDGKKYATIIVDECLQIIQGIGNIKGFFTHTQFEKPVSYRTKILCYSTPDGLLYKAEDYKDCNSCEKKETSIHSPNIDSVYVVNNKHGVKFHFPVNAKKLSIYNLQGQLMLTKKISERSIEISNIPNGLFIYKVESNDNKLYTNLFLKM